MFRIPKRYQTLLSVLAAVLLPILIYRANLKHRDDANLLDKAILFVTRPIKQLTFWGTGVVSDGWSHYVDLVDARWENGALRRRLRVAERARDALQPLGAENTRLRKLLHIRDLNPKFHVLVANVISAGSSPTARTLEIDQGSMQGLTPGLVVVADEGLVGLVERVGWTSSEVVLIADPRVLVSVLVVRSRLRGQVRGAGVSPRFSLLLTEALRVGDVHIGDQIGTSGMDSVFPAQIPVGEVVEVHDHAVAKLRSATVKPYVDFARLEQVAVLSAEPPPAIIATPETLLPPALQHALTSSVAYGWAPLSSTESSTVGSPE